MTPDALLRSPPTQLAADPAIAPKASWCRARLVSWFAHNGRDFPWRRGAASDYERIVVEVLLQRTQAATVAALYHAFFVRFPSWASLADVDEMALQQFLAPIGLWRRRAASLKALGRAVRDLGGVLPSDRVKLEALPGVGQYVASAILLFAHGRSEPLLDGGMARVLERAFAPRALVDIRYDAHLQRLSRLVVRSRAPAIVNWALLDLAADHCTRDQPRCDGCPLKRRCNHYKQGR